MLETYTVYAVLPTAEDATEFLAIKRRYNPGWKSVEQAADPHIVKFVFEAYADEQTDLRRIFLYDAIHRQSGVAHPHVVALGATNKNSWNHFRKGVFPGWEASADEFIGRQKTEVRLALAKAA